MPTNAELTDLIKTTLRELPHRIPDTPTVDAPSRSAAHLAGLIDHTLLKPDATADQIRQLCSEARQFGFASVCINAGWLPLATELLADRSSKVCTVIGFPLGATLTRVKAFETAAAIEHGAHEVDMVLAVGRLKSGDLLEVYADIAAVTEVAQTTGALVKVIIETALLSEDEKVAACVLAQQAGADFVKTSTGFNGGGATVADIHLMRAVVGARLGVKASGGVRTPAEAQAMVAAGATRIGASAGVRIVQAFSAPSAGEAQKDLY